MLFEPASLAYLSTREAVDYVSLEKLDHESTRKAMDKVSLGKLDPTSQFYTPLATPGSKNSRHFQLLEYGPICIGTNMSSGSHMFAARWLCWSSLSIVTTLTRMLLVKIAMSLNSHGKGLRRGYYFSI
jgi:hypothetical protein